MRTQNIYVMIGLPGAGKDTWIKKNLPECKCVACRDDIRVELGMCGPDEKYAGTFQEENLVSSVFNAKLLEYARSGEDIVINNTNLKRKYRMQYHRLLKDFNLNWVYVIIKAPSIEANIERRQGQIPAEVLRRMESSFEAPQPDEYDEIITVQQ